jgi:hypothetical protein
MPSRPRRLSNPIRMHKMNRCIGTHDVAWIISKRIVKVLNFRVRVRFHTEEAKTDEVLAISLHQSG